MYILYTALYTFPVGNFANSLIPKNDLDLISPYNITLN